MATTALHDHVHNHTMRRTGIIAIVALFVAASVVEAAAGTCGNQPKASTNRRRSRPSRSRGIDQDVPGKKHQQCTTAEAAAISFGGGGVFARGGAGENIRFDRQVARKYVLPFTIST